MRFHCTALPILSSKDRLEKLVPISHISFLPSQNVSILIVRILSPFVSRIVLSLQVISMFGVLMNKGKFL
jgi:hypothetical protein